jgi:hypothetical protein
VLGGVVCFLFVARFAACAQHTTANNALPDTALFALVLLSFAMFMTLISLLF